MVVKTAYEYIERAYGLGTDLKVDHYIDENYDEIQMLRQIIALDVSIYVMRRTNCVCGSNIDALRDMFEEKKQEYEKKFKRDYIDFNKDVDF
jgi:hypothetical protein